MHGVSPPKNSHCLDRGTGPLVPPPCFSSPEALLYILFLALKPLFISSHLALRVNQKPIGALVSIGMCSYCPRVGPYPQLNPFRSVGIIMNKMSSLQAWNELSQVCNGLL